MLPAAVPSGRDESESMVTEPLADGRQFAFFNRPG
jgi:hypothetical protein